MKPVVGLAFVFILGTLAYAGVAMLRGRRKGEAKNGRMMHALALRVALSVLLFICIMLGYKFGWLRPTGLPVGL